MNINQLILSNKNGYYIINPSEYKDTDSFLDEAACSLEKGFQIIQLNTNDCCAKTLIERGKRLRELCSLYNSLLIVKERIDIAQILSADGIHLEQDSMDIQQAKEIAGENIIIGISVQNQNQAEKAEKDGADYLITKESLKNIIIPYYKMTSSDNLVCYRSNNKINYKNK